jgi:hypothetical protein
VQHSLAAQAAGVFAEGDVGAIYAPPAYIARIGLANRWDIGLHVSPPSIGADVKWNAFQSTFFDFAIDPGAEAFAATNQLSKTARVVYLRAPFLLGFNVSPSATLVVVPGISFTKAAGEGTEDEEFYDADGRVLGHAGLGAQLRVSRRLALHPEMTVLGPYRDGGVLVLMGFGFSFGAFANYEDF